MSNEEYARAVAWLNEKVKKECPTCGQSDKGFVVLRDIITPTYINDGKYDYKIAHPMITIMCHVCGEVRFFTGVGTRILDSQLKVSRTLPGG